MYEAFEEERFIHLRASTQKNYACHSRFLKRHSKRISDYTPEDIRKLLKPLHDRPGAHNITRGLISVLMSMAVEKNYRTDNPVLYVKTMKLGSIKRWPESKILAAIDSLDGELHRIFKVMYLLGCRISDVLELGPQHVDGKVLRFRQIKTDALVQFELTPELTKLLFVDNNKLCDKFFSLTKADVYRFWAKVRKDFDLDDYTPHGLRKSAACEAAEGGATEAELQSMLGHRTPRAAVIYRREADQGMLAAEAIRKRGLQ